MLHGLINGLLFVHGLAASITAFFLVVAGGPMLWRKIMSGWRRTGVDLMLFPLDILASVFAGIIGIGLASFFWPVTVPLLLQDRASQQEERLREGAEEYETLLEEVRHARSDVTDPSHQR